MKLQSTRGEAQNEALKVNQCQHVYIEDSDIGGAGLGVNGGYNILMAHNTLYHVGTRSHLMDFVYGGRTCDGRDVARCKHSGLFVARRPDHSARARGKSEQSSHT